MLYDLALWDLCCAGTQSSPILSLDEPTPKEDNLFPAPREGFSYPTQSSPVLESS